jgi:hypothetical protein
MTPQEKAKELFDKCELSCAGILCFDDDWEALAKLCALIAVDEIIRELTEEISPSVHGFRHQYWIEVEQEIEKL